MINGIPLCEHDRAYHARILQHKIWASLAALFATAAVEEGMTKSKLANIIGKDQSIVSRVFSNPSNLTLDTIALIAAALGKEADIQFLDVEDNPRHNYVHPLLEHFTVPQKSTSFIGILGYPQPDNFVNGAQSLEMRLC